MSLLMPFMKQLPGKFQDSGIQFFIPNCSDIWPTVSRLVDLHVHGDPKKITRKIVHQYALMRNKYRPDIKINSTKDAIYDFMDYMFYPQIWTVTNPAIRILDDIKAKSPDEFSRFDVFYRQNIRNENINRYKSTLSDYFRNFDQFRQMIVHARINSNDISNYVVGSKNFEQVKLYYGQAYEALTSNYTVIACLYNMSRGRKFDAFESMSLSKYINDVEKSNKSNPFKNDPSFSAFCTHEDSSLRNGSHHASIWREEDIVKYRSGGTGAEREINYAEYLHICNGITISLAALMMLEAQLFLA